MPKLGFFLAITTVLWIGSASPLYADASATASVTYDGTTTGGGTDGPNTGTTQAQATLTNSSNLAKSQVDAWTFKSYAKLDLIAGQSNGQAIASASYSDSITISAADPGVVTFVFRVEGTLTQSSDYTLKALHNGNLVDDPTWSYEFPGTIGELWGFNVSYTPGVPFDFQVESRSRAFQTTGGSGLVVSNFFNTASMYSIQLDAPNATISGLSGFNYQSMVPEPAGLNLLALIALVSLRAPRRCDR